MQQPPNNQNENGNFFDPKTLLAIVLVGLVWMGWQNYLSTKYPDAYKQKAEEAVLAEQGKTSQKAVAENARPAKELKNNQGGTFSKPIADGKDVPEQILTYNDEFWTLKFSSYGMALKEIYLNSYTDRENQPIPLSPESGFMPFETNLVGRQAPLNFQMKQVEDKVFLGRAQWNGMIVEKRVTLKPESYSFDTEITVSQIGDGFSGLVNFVSKKVHKVESSFFMPAMNQQEFFVAHGTTTDREYLSPETGIEPSAYAQAALVSLGEQYFSLALVDKSDVIPEAKFNFDLTTSIGLTQVSHSIINRANTFKIAYTGYAGPKDLDILKQVDPRLAELVDFGWFSWLARILFDILRWFYSILGNWGLAIIALTILVRLFVLPFHMMSYKSMKGMQEIQPQIKALREKYKDDQQKLNQEMMEFMKEHKVNPVGGCLPMLLQFPVFIALYRCFGQSIDLYKAPFAFWISDLSLKDPYYILPVVMGIVFFFQTKLTPSTMDPTQKKVMMIMPVMFSFFMMGLPSALTLYMCVSTIFGFVQQLYVMKDTKKDAPAEAVKA